MKVFQYLEIFGFKALQSSVKSSGFPGNNLFLFSEILGLGLYSLEILLKENKREEKTKHLWQLHQQMIKSKIWIKQRESILSFRPYKAEAKRGLVKVAKHLVHPRQNLMRWVGDGFMFTDTGWRLSRCSNLEAGKLTLTPCSCRDSFNAWSWKTIRSSFWNSFMI